MPDKIIYTFWTGDNQLSDNRKKCLLHLIQHSQMPVVLITKDNLKQYTDKAIHPAYEYLSLTHKGDYLRTHFMHYHGGGYSDIKQCGGSWLTGYTQLCNSDKWMIGYKEINGGVAYEPLKHNYNDLIGNGCYICKPNTPLTHDWYNAMIHILDNKLHMLKDNPGDKNPAQQYNEYGYPLRWSEILGQVFHRVSYKYKDKLLNTLPMCNLSNYR